MILHVSQLGLPTRIGGTTYPRLQLYIILVNIPRNSLLSRSMNIIIDRSRCTQCT